MFDLKVETCLGPGHPAVRQNYSLFILFLKIFHNTRHRVAMPSKILAFTASFSFQNSLQQLAASVCRPLGGVVSNPSLHPAGQSAQNRSLERRGNQLPVMPDGHTFTPEGQQKRGKQQPLKM